MFKGHVGAASPRLLELMNRVAEIRGEVTFDGLNDDDNALDHRWHCILALVLKGDALDMLMKTRSQAEVCHAGKCRTPACETC